MSGAGHMLHAIKTLKQNRSLLKKRRTAKEKGFNYSTSETKPVFKTVSPEELRRIKAKIRKEGNAVKRRDFIITLIVAFIGVGIFFYLYFGL